MESEDWRIVTTASGLTNARIITGRLETDGIPTRLQYEAAGAVYAITIDGLGEVKIFVPAADLDRAREILDRSYDEADLAGNAGGPDPAAL
jgi:YD repeat-containing protein